MNAASGATTFLMLGLLAGCGGGGGSSDGDDGFPPAPSSFAALDARGLALEEDGEGLTYTDPSTLPTSGVARYDGTIGIDGAFVEGSPEFMLGDLRIEARFADDAIRGAATNFVTPGEQRVTGTLSIADGTIDRGADVDVDYTFEAGLRGTLTDAVGSDIDIDGAVRGDFFGPDQTYVSGEVIGDVTDSGGTGAISGGFIARR